MKVRELFLHNPHSHGTCRASCNSSPLAPLRLPSAGRRTLLSHCDRKPMLVTKLSWSGQWISLLSFQSLQLKPGSDLPCSFSASKFHQPLCCQPCSQPCHGSHQTCEADVEALAEASFAHRHRLALPLPPMTLPLIISILSALSMAVTQTPEVEGDVPGSKA